MTVDERIARGVDARRHAPRSSHGQFEVADDRPDPIALLEEQEATRVPELVPIRHGRMLESPFAFYRGAALVMATDLAATPRTGITVQLCGDAHLSNFGLYGTPERRLVFDINDFDETLPGPWEWDVKRLAASFEIMGRERCFTDADRRAIVMAAAHAYRDRIRAAAVTGTLEVWYDHLEAGQLLDDVEAEVQRGRMSKKELKATAAGIAKARTRDSVRVFTRHVGSVGDDLHIVANPPLIVPIEDVVAAMSGPGSPEWRDPEAVIKGLLESYRKTLSVEHHPVEEFTYVHAARKVVGVGSVGTRCYIVLLVGRDEDDPLILQVKEAQPSVLERFLGASAFPQQGQRVVAGQHLMQAASDAFLGWQQIDGPDGVVRDFYVRQLHDWKGSLEFEDIRVDGATQYARICGATLARAHARWGDRVALAAYLGKGDNFDRAMADFAVAYADQNERDYEALTKAVDSGRLAVEVGV